MATTPISALPYPLASAAPAAASDILALATALDPKLVLTAAGVSDRDTKYGGSSVPAGVLVVSPSTKQAWLKTGTAPAAWTLAFDGNTEKARGFAGTTPSWNGTEIFKDVTIDISGAGFATVTSAQSTPTAGPSFASTSPSLTLFVTSMSTSSVTVRVKSGSALSAGSTVGVYLSVTGVLA